MTLLGYIVKRALISVFILWLVATLNFLILYSEQGLLAINSPPDIGRLVLEGYGYGDPPHVRYLKYLRNMFSFGVVPPYFGWSNVHSQFVAEGLYWRLPITLLLLGSVLEVSAPLGILIGMMAASKRGTKFDIMSVASSVVTYNIPAFVIQLFTLFLFGRVFWEMGIRLTPTFSPPAFATHDLSWWLQVYQQLLIPISTLVLTGLAYWILTTRYLILDVLSQDYIITARAKGIGERAILFKHAFKSIHPQIATMITLSLPTLVTGTIITEMIYGIEGVGRYYLQSFTMNYMTVVVIDSAVTQAVFFILAVLVVTCNFIVDVAYGFMDPRIRVGNRL